MPAGLLGQAIELLDLRDELLNHPGHDCIDAHLRKLISRDQLTGHAASIRWHHEAPAATADELQNLIDVAAIVVEPTLRHRPRRHHQR